MDKVYTSVQQLDNLPSPYRLVTFKLEPAVIRDIEGRDILANKVRLRECYYNPTYVNYELTTNKLPYLRRITLVNPARHITELGISGGDIGKYIDVSAYNDVLVNPYYDTLSYPDNDWRLCTVYIPPGQYRDVDDLVGALNQSFYTAFSNLYGITKNAGNYRIRSGLEHYLYDTYHLTMYTILVTALINDTEPIFVRNISPRHSHLNKLQFVFNLIPVQYTRVAQVVNYTQVVKNHVFDDNNTTLFLPNITVYSGDTFITTDSLSRISHYNTELARIEEFYSMFSTFNCIWNYLYHKPCTVSYDDVLTDSSGAPVCTVAGKTYVEHVYHGDLIAVRDYYIHDSHGTIRINIGDNVFEWSTDIVNRYFMTNTSKSYGGADFTIVDNIIVKVSQNADVEKVVNMRREQMDSSAIAYDLSTTAANTPIIGIGPQTFKRIDIGRDYDLYKDTPLYVYLTSPDLAYPLELCDAKLIVEYYIG